jgi:dipeptidase E
VNYATGGSRTLPDMLLLSNSVAPGRGFLEHALGTIAEVLQERRSLLFIALASGEPDRYTEIMQGCMAPIGVRVEWAQSPADLRRAVADAQAVFVGGGNSFRLLKRLRALDALDELRARVLAGVPYLGASAGANLACPTIRTTNDMPIVDPGSFQALGLIPFQVNAHYPDTEPADPRSGDTRQRQIAGFLEENDIPVLGLREGTWLRVCGGAAVVGGVTGCRLYRRGMPAEELAAGSDVSALLDLPARFDVSEAAGPAQA